MSDHSKIEWTDATWNPVTGCTKVSAGCDHCYIERTPPFRIGGRRFDKPGVGGSTGVLLHEDRLGQPLSWRKPRRVFVNSLADLFHEAVPDEYILRVFAVMALARRHTFQVLTKRPARMRALLSKMHPLAITAEVHREKWVHGVDAGPIVWPLPNVWLGVSTENQQWADARIPILIDTPAAVRWISAEPLLGPIDLHGPVDPRISGRPKLTYWLSGRPGWGETKPIPGSTMRGRSIEVGPRLDWVVVGGESGRGARPMHPDWARAVRDQCVRAGAPLDDMGHREVIERMGKKAAGRVLDGRTWDEYPDTVHAATAAGKDTTS